MTNLLKTLLILTLSKNIFASSELSYKQTIMQAAEEEERELKEEFKGILEETINLFKPLKFEHNSALVNILLLYNHLIYLNKLNSLLEDIPKNAEEIIKIKTILKKNIRKLKLVR